MSQCVIVTDSSADLSHEMVQALGVDCLLYTSRCV